MEIWRKRLAESPDTYNLLACAENEVIGQYGLHTFPQIPSRRLVGQIDMAVRDDWHGKGTGSALMQAGFDLADNWLNLSRIELEVYTDNESAMGLYKKLALLSKGHMPCLHIAMVNLWMCML